MLKRRALALSLVLSLLVLPLLPETSGQDEDVRARFRREGMDHSQIMKTMHMLADVYGPRLTGSPNHKRAAEWTIKQMKQWGLENGRLEPWDFKHPGWLNERLSAHVVSPVKDALVCEVLAWTPSTSGTVCPGESLSAGAPGKPHSGKVEGLSGAGEGEGAWSHYNGRQASNRPR